MSKAGFHQAFHSLISETNHSSAITSAKMCTEIASPRNNPVNIFLSQMKKYNAHVSRAVKRAYCSTIVDCVRKTALPVSKIAAATLIRTLFVNFKLIKYVKATVTLDAKQDNTNTNFNTKSPGSTFKK